MTPSRQKNMLEIVFCFVFTVLSFRITAPKPVKYPHEGYG